MRYRTFLIGLGQIGMGYDYEKDSKDFRITHCSAIFNHPDFEMVGSFDSLESVRVKFENKYKAVAYSKLEEGLLQTQPDFIVIATPTMEHLESVRLSLEYASPSFILCEKPISYSKVEADEILKLCSSKNVRLFVNYQRRYFPSAKEIKEQLEQIGPNGFIKGICWYSKGLFHNGTHFLDLLRYWLGPIRSGSVIHKNRFWDNKDPEPDVYFEFDKGGVFFLSSREEDYSHYAIELVTSEGKLSYLKGGEEIFWESKVSDPLYPGFTTLNDLKKYFSNDSNYSQHHVLTELSKAMNGKESQCCDANESIEIIQLLNQITDFV
ncbi:Gfo/Idh/MocA family oxidoreductase [Leptospira yasudae]|uniref:Gfo/Idh/MocA family protein n=1 Tax=Leptospira yasudae TaxID=2202201 RepID=UPI001C502137|nr:Gfo/Idh/MocA family oxidoreductase [Leptospira yasudae]MBW0434110.1 Gfo/Idh/MocA family oxidoreductase [Leptospira yasudae]